MRACVVLLGVLSLVFAARVLGQLLVAVFGIGCLPPMDAWYSGLIPYPALLPIQIAILAIQLEISWELWVGAGAVSVSRPLLGRVLTWVSLVYFLAIVARLVITSVTLPEAGRFGDISPTVFHWVLAASLWILSRHLRGRPFFGQSALAETSCPS
ncbi:MAG: hypothetical protein IH939_04800 [Acidobacteria bacterium]|nr:hypothetical protein [Acidobacteriota bacterium]